MPHQLYKQRNTRIVYDDGLVSDPVALFDPRHHHNQGHAGTLERGTALFFEFDGVPMVLKHYHRGGLLGRLVNDTYLCFPLSTPRMLAEFRLLVRLRELTLPAPLPVAARWQTSGRLTCRGDLVTRRIPGVSTLYERICEAALGKGQWERIGRTIAAFHSQGVYHADLNATNILLDDDAQCHLIDFDKGAFRRGERWKAGNLKRLRRSLDKLLHLTPGMHFREADWQALMDAYRKGDPGRG